MQAYFFIGYRCACGLTNAEACSVKFSWPQVHCVKKRDPHATHVGYLFLRTHCIYSEYMIMMRTSNRIATPYYYTQAPLSHIITTTCYMPRAATKIIIINPSTANGGEITPRAHFCPLLRHLDQQPKILPWLFLNMFSARNGASLDFLWLRVMTQWRVKVTSFF